MSKKEVILRIKPPITGLRSDSEVFRYDAFKCPSCQGRGYFTKNNEYHGSAGDDIDITDCHRCNGTGRLCANIVIRWMPDEVMGDFNTKK
ncbi:hypothetical protein D0T49_00280 [Paludibacter sp. 221]|uniref:hypothetical protein n=1 Tax=Paludibacter sp. 221 TaxID=2302939 RepID=UPI0013D475DD|nr:hypothetical protein [Paludibacter sp. 221]NDV45489.1 hypothetical protein [Paludibacter sp. 221]